ncbi:MAG: SAM-dependent methyltransferase [Candidatus Galacturonibacter soehngenii]|nr:SAM-dependent methyltransferase [Candidatus Galacturonibacter soehngenii]
MFRFVTIGTISKKEHITIRLNAKYKKGLRYVERFDYIHVFYRNHRGNCLEKQILKIVRVQHETGEIIAQNQEFKGTDLEVFDIKPYFPCEDAVEKSQFEKEEGQIQSMKQIALESAQEEEGVFYVNAIGSIHKKGMDTYIEVESKYDMSMLKRCSHITFLWWFHKFDNEKYRRCVECNPPYENAKRTGVFATRSPVRPNPIAMSVARMIKIEQNRIYIHDAECFEGTPCISIWPYDREQELLVDVNVPDWLKHWPKWLDDRTPATIQGTIEEEYDVLSQIMDISDKPDKEKMNRDDFDQLFGERKEPVQQEELFVEGARENNLKGFSVQIPYRKITAVVGVSGSGKSSLVKNTIYTECRRRMEGVSDYAKTLERPNMTRMGGVIPALYLSQREIGNNSRSTVGTYSECYDSLRKIYATIGKVHCPECKRPIITMTQEEICQRLECMQEVFIYNLRKEEIKQGSLRDKIKIALEESDGALYAKTAKAPFELFQTTQKCYHCNRIIFELTPSDFNYRDPESMCIKCNGLGEVREVDLAKVIERPDLSILDGASSFWGKLRNFLKSPNANWMKGEVIGLANQMHVDLEKPWSELPKEFRHKVLYGCEEEVTFTYSNNKNGRTGSITRPVEGVCHVLNRICLEKNSTQANYYMTKTLCKCCQGERLHAKGRLVRVGQVRYPQVAKMSFDQIADWCISIYNQLDIEEWKKIKTHVVKLYQIAQSANRLGIGYLELDRSITSVSGGEAQRLKFLSSMLNELTGILYILDEPSKGLHPKDYIRIIQWMEYLKKMGNTIIMVEHNEDMIKAADYLIEIGPSAGEEGGYLVAKGSLLQMMQNEKTKLSTYLKEGKKNVIYKQKNLEHVTWLRIYGAKYQNLKNIDVHIPIGAITCITGVSGSGKSSLLKGVLYEELSRIKDKLDGRVHCDRVELPFSFDKIIMVEQTAMGRNSRSVPATYIGVMDEIRKLFANQEEAINLNLTESAFSFNAALGQCPNCHGEGQITPKFMDDILLTCPVCKGRRYKKNVLDIRYQKKNISDVLQLSVKEALAFFKEIEEITTPLSILMEVGLSYLKLGQNLVKISGGEATRLKLAKELMIKQKQNTIYLIDEPTTGLHFTDIEKLILLFQKLVDFGNTIVLIDHNKQIRQNCDWLIELGPKAAKEGGNVMRQEKITTFHD